MWGATVRDVRTFKTEVGGSRRVASGSAIAKNVSGSVVCGSPGAIMTTLGTETPLTVVKHPNFVGILWFLSRPRRDMAILWAIDVV